MQAHEPLVLLDQSDIAPDARHITGSNGLGQPLREIHDGRRKRLWAFRAGTHAEGIGRQSEVQRLR